MDGTALIKRAGCVLGLGDPDDWTILVAPVSQNTPPPSTQNQLGGTGEDLSSFSPSHFSRIRCYDSRNIDQSYGANNYYFEKGDMS